MLTNSLVNVSCLLSYSGLTFASGVTAIANTEVGQDAPPTSEVKPIKCNDLVSLLVLWGWLLKSTYKINSSDLASAKCSLDHRECAKINVFPGTLKP